MIFKYNYFVSGAASPSLGLKTRGTGPSQQQGVTGPPSEEFLFLLSSNLNILSIH